MSHTALPNRAVLLETPRTTRSAHSRLGCRAYVSIYPRREVHPPAPSLCGERSQHVRRGLRGRCIGRRTPLHSWRPGVWNGYGTRTQPPQSGRPRAAFVRRAVVPSHDRVRRLLPLARRFCTVGVCVAASSLAAVLQRRTLLARHISERRDPWWPRAALRFLSACESPVLCRLVVESRASGGSDAWRSCFLLTSATRSRVHGPAALCRSAAALAQRLPSAVRSHALSLPLAFTDKTVAKVVRCIWRTSAADARVNCPVELTGTYPSADPTPDV